MRGATEAVCGRLGACAISIHAPHARSDDGDGQAGGTAKFQSTLLMRGATKGFCHRGRDVAISIHAPHARSDVRKRCIEVAPLDISIHAPHARSDAMSSMLSAFSILFQSTLLMRGATPTHGRLHYHRPISIHAPHARSDRRCCRCYTRRLYFNPRSSCEERPPYRHPSARCSDFNPRSSCEERRPVFASRSIRKISIHAPHARSDPHRSSPSRRHSYFNPRSSCEERRFSMWNTLTCDDISIHAPHARSDSCHSLL